MVKLICVFLLLMLYSFFYIVFVHQDYRPFHNGTQEKWSLKIEKNTTSVACLLSSEAVVF